VYKEFKNLFHGKGAKIYSTVKGWFGTTI